MNLLSNSTDQKQSCCTAQVQSPWSTHPRHKLQALRLMLCLPAHPKTLCFTRWGTWGPSAPAVHSWSESDLFPRRKLWRLWSTQNLVCPVKLPTPTALSLACSCMERTRPTASVRVRNWEAATEICFQSFPAKGFAPIGKKKQIVQWWTTELISRHVVLQCSVLLANNELIAEGLSHKSIQLTQLVLLIHKHSRWFKTWHKIYFVRVVLWEQLKSGQCSSSLSNICKCGKENVMSPTPKPPGYHQTRNTAFYHPKLVISRSL